MLRAVIKKRLIAILALTLTFALTPAEYAWAATYTSCPSITVGRTSGENPSVYSGCTIGTGVYETMGKITSNYYIFLSGRSSSLGLTPLPSTSYSPGNFSDRWLKDMGAGYTGDCTDAADTGTNAQWVTADTVLCGVTTLTNGNAIIMTVSYDFSATTLTPISIVYGPAPDPTAPRITSIERQTPSTSPTDADSLTWQVTFNEDVQNVDVTDFTVSGTTATVTNVTQTTASTVFNVTASGGDLANLNGTVTLGFDGSQNITDTTGNALSNTTPTGTNNNTFSVVNDADAPTVTFSPAAGATGVSADSNLTLTFSETVNIISGGASLTDTNVDALITLKLNNASGADIAFDATTNGTTTITINPTANLPKSATIYAAIGATLEDAAGNALSASNATFTIVGDDSPLT